MVQLVPFQTVALGQAQVLLVELNTISPWQTIHCTPLKCVPDMHSHLLLTLFHTSFVLQFAHPFPVHTCPPAH